ncbi:MAG: transcription elongation factor GreA [Deltaproteobacteria bacterium]|nr:transcription elongation factor GreA [Deltaproteobacteria bacterium]
MSNGTPITPRGLAKLHEQLQHLREVERPKNVRDIEEARAHGDLRENAESHAAKERQAMIAGTMQMLETSIATATVIDPKTLSGSRVVFGATVTVTDVDTEQEFVYQIVGDPEADLKQGLISISSPIARSLIGREAGDEIAATMPGGKRTFAIEKVEFK